MESGDVLLLVQYNCVHKQLLLTLAGSESRLVSSPLVSAVRSLGHVVSLVTMILRSCEEKLSPETLKIQWVSDQTDANLQIKIFYYHFPCVCVCVCVEHLHQQKLKSSIKNSFSFNFSSQRHVQHVELSQKNKCRPRPFTSINSSANHSWGGAGPRRIWQCL